MMRLKLYGSLGAILLLLSSNAMAAPTQAQIDAAYAEARTRISPITTAMDVNQNARSCGFKGDATTEYTVTWTVKSYESNITALMSINDCKGKTDFTCGNAYGDQRIYTSPTQETTGSTTTNWNYTATNGVTVQAYLHNFSVIFTIPATHFDGSDWSSEEPSGGDKVVFRWWQLAPLTTLPGAGSVTLLLGTEAGYHYGNDARRIQSTVSFDLDTASPTCAVE